MNLLSAEAIEAMRLMDECPRDAVIQMDAVELLSHLPDASVDLTIVDPAYESLEKHRAKGTTTRLKDSKASSNEWFPIFRNSRLPCLLEHLYRVMKPRTHVYVFCDETTSDILKPMAVDAGFYVWKTMTWVKTVKSTNGIWHLIHDAITDVVEEMGNPHASMWKSRRTTALSLRKALWRIGTDQICSTLTRTGMGYHWRASSERILFLEKRDRPQKSPWDPMADPKGKGRKLNDLSQKDVLYGTSPNQYPTQKPLEVVETLLLNSSNEGETVLDFFAGSGVVGVAAQKHNRHFILSDVSDNAIAFMQRELQDHEP